MRRGDGWFRITLFNGRSCSVRPSQHLVVVDRHAEESLSFFSTITCHVRLVSLAATKREEQKEQRERGSDGTTGGVQLYRPRDQIEEKGKHVSCLSASSHLTTRRSAPETT